MSKLAQQHGINANMLFKWRGDLRAGLLTDSRPQPAQLLPAVVRRNPVLPTFPSATIPAGFIEIVIADAVVRVSAGTDAALLRCCVAPACTPRLTFIIGLSAGTRIWLAARITDMRAGMNGLAAKVKTALAEDPYCGQVFVFRGRRGDMLKVLWSSGDGLCLLAKRLDRGRFVWPQANNGTVSLTQAQLSMLIKGIDGRRPERTLRPTSALYTFAVSRKLSPC